MYYYTVREGSATTTLKNLSVLQYITWPNRVISFVRQNGNFVEATRDKIENIRKQLDLARLDRLLLLTFGMIIAHDFVKRNMCAVRKFLRNIKVRRELNLALKVIKRRFTHKLVVRLFLTLAFSTYFLQVWCWRVTVISSLKRLLKRWLPGLSLSG